VRAYVGWSVAAALPTAATIRTATTRPVAVSLPTRTTGVGGVGRGVWATAGPGGGAAAGSGGALFAAEHATITTKAHRIRHPTREIAFGLLTSTESSGWYKRRGIASRGAAEIATS
jgi:hypothetical protein